MSTEWSPMEKSRGSWASWLAVVATGVQAASALLLFGGPPGEVTRFDHAALGVLGLPVNLAALVRAGAEGGPDRLRG